MAGPNIWANDDPRQQQRGQQGGGGQNVDWNKIYEQATHSGDYTPTMFGELTRMGGYGFDLGGAINGAMGQMQSINEGNANRNALENQVMGQYRAAVDPIAMQEQGKTARMGQLFGGGGLGSLLGGLFNGPSQGGGGGGAGGFGGFKATDGNGNPSSSAIMPGAGGAQSPVAAAGPSVSGAQAVNTQQYMNPNEGQRLSPQAEAEWYRTHGVRR